MGSDPDLNDCPDYNIKLSDGEGSSPGDLGNVEYLFITIAPRSTLAQSGYTWKGPIYG